MNKTTPDKEKIREEFVKWTKEGKLLKLEKGEYDIRKGYEPEEIADWWLDKMEAQKAELIEKLEINCPIIENMTVKDGKLYLSLELKDLEPFDKFRILPDQILSILRKEI